MYRKALAKSPKADNTPLFQRYVPDRDGKGAWLDSGQGVKGRKENYGYFKTRACVNGKK